ncbi:MAG TPA: hypothetical protein VHA30_00085, partial [Patescibacteria group bacterium]|nr:hypothetical protein [Patescibacteria group bacterium]
MVQLAQAVTFDEIKAYQLGGKVLGASTFPYSPPVTYPGGSGYPQYCDNFGSYTVPAICHTPAMEPAGHFNIPALGGTYTDQNFGATVKIMTDPSQDWYHNYSTISPFSAHNKYYTVQNIAGNIQIRDTATNALVREAPQLEGLWAGGSDYWSAVDDDIMYLDMFHWDGTQYVYTKLYKYSVSQDKLTLLVDYSKAPYNFSSISTGGKGTVSKDDWIAMLVNDKHLICVVNFNNPATDTYCTDYTTSNPAVNKVDWPTDHMATHISKGIDSQTGKRYVVAESSAGLAVFSFDPTTKQLSLDDRPEGAPDMMSPGNGNGICDPGEGCPGTPHMDTFEDSAGIQYVAFGTGVETPCADDFSSYQLSKAATLNMTVSVKDGGGRKDIFTKAVCGSEDWSSDHIGCAASAPYCLIDNYFGAVPAGYPTTIHDGNDPFGFEMIVIKNNGDEVRRVAMNNSVVSGYLDQPVAALSPDGSYTMFNSNFG